MRIRYELNNVSVFKEFSRALNTTKEAGNQPPMRRSPGASQINSTPHPEIS